MNNNKWYNENYINKIINSHIADCLYPDSLINKYKSIEEWSQIYFVECMNIPKIHNKILNSPYNGNNDRIMESVRNSVKEWNKVYHLELIE